MKDSVIVAQSNRRDLVKSLVFNHQGKLNPRSSKLEWWQKCHQAHLYTEIFQLTNFLTDDATYAERIYCYCNGLDQKPQCRMCDNTVAYNKIKKQYAEYCSNACVNLDGKHLYQKKKHTEMQRYGKKCDFSDQLHVDQTRKTCKVRYGNENHMQVGDIQEKIKQTHIKKYGEYYTSTEEYKTKTRNTCQQKYGEEHWMKTSEYREQFSLKNGNKKISQAMLGEIQQRYSAGEAKQHIAADLDLSLSHMGKVIKSLGMESDLPQNKINFSQNFVSQGEIELRNIVGKIFCDYEIQYNVRNIIWPQEIDIVIPELKLMFEYNGTYWHSDFFKHKHYHVNKLDQVEALGYTLVNIFENHFRDNKQQLLSKIASKLPKQPVYHARKMKVTQCQYAEIAKFLRDTHIQGERKTSINFKVTDQSSQIVAVATFKKYRDGLELIRFTSNRRIPGILRKILSKLDTIPIYSFADRCYTNRYNNIYLSSGFQEIQVTPPGYFYVKGDHTVSRYQSMKHKLNNQLPNFDKYKTEYDNMISHGFHRTWNCGNILYKYS